MYKNADNGPIKNTNCGQSIKNKKQRDELQLKLIIIVSVVVTSLVFTQLIDSKSSFLSEQYSCSDGNVRTKIRF